ncbi:FAD-dependent oxidoreductase [Pseudonocardia parietis]|uniref:Succinate dehydrogenase/fumarate reductase flavoprotein subunit n=1 Tax=Pseudonocardia parietis TaxID=570936 RepID=A0ABS4VSL4_9PSEU|nr:FAD-dependent oxidoreductase [Pseudonocardia parietis]MBP2366549.1 succinate dehydrogenase/fumarate reductase flavoprotein subunit [Pseudonocardia parietis]
MAAPAETLQADVVVLGAGPGGMAAVAAAADAGATVVVLEAQEHIGGNAVWSTGYLAFVGSAMQAEQGIVDDEERFVADARAQAELLADRYGLEWDEDLVRLFARESARTYDDLTERGVRFTRFIPRPRQHSVDRMAAVEDSWMLGRAYTADFRRDEVTVRYGTVADRLVVEDGRVTGVLAHRSSDGGQVRVEARRAVVLATGGYQANPDLRRRFQPGFAARGPYLGIDSCRGDGHLMGQAVGGDLVNMTVVPPLVIVSSSVVEDAIAVNPAGERFHDEAGPYEERVERLRAEPGRRAWYVVDSTVAGEKEALIGQMPEPAVQAPTLAALAGLIGVPGAALESTVQRWNAFLDGGADTDPDFGRVVLPPGRRRCETGPFTAVPMIEGINFCCGGFRTTTEQRVIDVFGRTLPGLFAVGDCVGGLNPVSDLGGIHICGALTFGRLAGRAAALGDTDAADHGSVLHAGMPSMLGTRVALVHLDGRLDAATPG